MERIEEVFTPDWVQTVDDLIAFMVEAIRQRGGDPTTLKLLDTESVVPNVQFSDDWPCFTLNFQIDTRNYDDKDEPIQGRPGETEQGGDDAADDQESPGETGDGS